MDRQPVLENTNPDKKRMLDSTGSSEGIRLIKGGSRKSKKRSIYRRRRSSNKRQSRKARSTRRK